MMLRRFRSTCQGFFDFKGEVRLARRKPSHFLAQVIGARAIASKKESVIPLCRTMEYKLAVDSSKKATELPLLRVCGTVQQNPHMRAFWASTISFFLAFLGCFVRIY